MNTNDTGECGCGNIAVLTDAATQPTDTTGWVDMSDMPALTAHCKTAAGSGLCGQHVRGIAEFSNLARHCREVGCSSSDSRVDHSASLGCLQTDEPPTHENSGVDHDLIAFDIRTLRALVGIDSEVCLDESDDDLHARRESRLRKLKVVDGLELVCFGSTADPIPQPSATYGTRPQAGAQHTSSTHHPNPNPPAHSDAHPEFDYSSKPAWDWAYRIDANGTCSKDSKVHNAFQLAYLVIWSAHNELNKWNDLGINMRRHLWDRGQISSFRAAPGYWFGASDSPNFADRFFIVRQTIRSWLNCFRHGFYGDGIHQPVLIRCHRNEDTGNVAYHWEPNVVTLCEPWFALGPKNGAMVLLHEMGHFSGQPIAKLVDWWMPWLGAAYDPRDRRNNHCDWSGTNKCYQAVHMNDAAQMFLGGNPKILANLFDGGDLDAGKDMLGNIDNYVSYMWNRFQDHDWPALVGFTY